MSSRPGLLIVAGGMLMAALWLVFTSIHGPTSFNEDRLAVGRDMQKAPPWMREPARCCCRSGSCSPSRWPGRSSRSEVSDPVGGYRIYGFMAHFLTGLGWAPFGVLTARRVRADILAPADLG